MRPSGERPNTWPETDYHAGGCDSSIRSRGLVGTLRFQLWWKLDIAMLIDERVHAVIRALYDAAMDETLWPGALKELTDLTGSQGASFWVLDGSDQPRLPTFTTVNFDPNFIEKYLDDMVPMDPIGPVSCPPSEPAYCPRWPGDHGAGERSASLLRLAGRPQ